MRSLGSAAEDFFCTPILTAGILGAADRAGLPEDGRTHLSPFSPDASSTGEPPRFRDSDDASKMRTISSPRLPSVNGVAPFWMQSRKCWHSVFNGSSCLM